MNHVECRLLDSGENIGASGGVDGKVKRLEIASVFEWGSGFRTSWNLSHNPIHEPVAPGGQK